MASMQPKLSKGSWKQYQHAAKKLKILFADFAPDEIHQSDVQDMLTELDATPLHLKAGDTLSFAIGYDL